MIINFISFFISFFFFNFILLLFIEKFSIHISVEEDAQLIPSGMTNDCIAQTWYRFLRTIGSPIALCSPQVISKTPQFMQWVVSRADGVEAFNHPCLLQLPLIFLKAIKGIASQVDAFLGMD